MAWKKFADTLTAFENSLVKPRISIAEKREATRGLQTLFILLDSQISKLDAIIGIIRYNEVNFYNGYKTIRKLVNINTGVVALKATASDIVTSEPIKGVLFTLKSDSTVLTKRTADKGSFLIRNMKPGTYEVAVKKDGYKEKALSVSISDRERSELKVELEKS